MIQLPLPIYHPYYFKLLCSLLNGACLNCHKFVARRKETLLVNYQLQALHHGLVETVHEMETIAFKVVEKSNRGKAKEKESLVEDEAVEEDLGGLEDSMELEEFEIKLKELLASNLKSWYNSAHEKIDFWSRNLTDLNGKLIRRFLISIKRKVSKCPHCCVRKDPIRGVNNSKILSGQSFLPPSDVEDHFTLLWKNEGELLSNVFRALMIDSSQESPKSFEKDEIALRHVATKLLFLNVLCVPASRFRPPSKLKGRTFESDQTVMYGKIVMDCLLIKALLREFQLKKEGKGVTEEEVDEKQNESSNSLNWKAQKKAAADDIETLVRTLRGQNITEKLQNVWERLQQHVNALFDADLDKLTPYGVDRTPGLKQLLEKKQGLFRKHMMGKRVNFAARSVISPDPYIATNEIGVPQVRFLVF